MLFNVSGLVNFSFTVNTCGGFNQWKLLKANIDVFQPEFYYVAEIYTFMGK